ncbi:hypothetical protein Emag_002734 [Eimeria magna]
MLDLLSTIWRKGRRKEQTARAAAAATTANAVEASDRLPLPRSKRKSHPRMSLLLALSLCSTCASKTQLGGSKERFKNPPSEKELAESVLNSLGGPLDLPGGPHGGEGPPKACKSLGLAWGNCREGPFHFRRNLNRGPSAAASSATKPKQQQQQQASTRESSSSSRGSSDLLLEAKGTRFP